MSPDGWMGKEMYVCIHTHTIYAMKLSHSEEWNLGICHNMDETWGHYAKWNKAEKHKYRLVSLTRGIKK